MTDIAPALTAPFPNGTADRDARRSRYLATAVAVTARYRHKSPVLFGPSALQVLGVALPTSLDDWERVHILIPQGMTRTKPRGVVCHRTWSAPTVWRTIGGVPLPHPVESWIQLRGATEDELVEVGDGLLRRRHPLLTPDELRAALIDVAGRPGATRVARILRWLRPGTDSLYETRTRLILVHAGLPCPVVNLPVFCGSSGREYHVDMGYEPERVAVEYDGVDHVGERRQMEIDARRRRDLQDEGWLVITVTADQLREPRQIVRSVETALHLRRTSLRQAW